MCRATTFFTAGERQEISRDRGRPARRAA